MGSRFLVMQYDKLGTELMEGWKDGWMVLEREPQ